MWLDSMWIVSKQVEKMVEHNRLRENKNKCRYRIVKRLSNCGSLEFEELIFVVQEYSDRRVGSGHTKEYEDRASFNTIEEAKYYEENLILKNGIPVCEWYKW